MVLVAPTRPATAEACLAAPDVTAVLPLVDTLGAGAGHEEVMNRTPQRGVGSCALIYCSTAECRQGFPNQGGSMLKRSVAVMLLGGLLLLGAPSVASADKGSGHMGSRHMDDRRAMHRVDDRRADGRRDRDDRDRFSDRRHRHFNVFYFYYPYYSPCGYSYRSYYPYSYSYRHYYRPYYCGYPYDAGYQYGGQYGGSYGDQYGGDYGDQYGGQNPPDGVVVIRNIAFHPSELRAKVGQDVVWSWQDHGIAHTVTADDGSCDSGRQMGGEYHHVFDHPGKFAYHCRVHPDRMMGTVVVTS